MTDSAIGRQAIRDDHCATVKRKTTHRHLYLPKDYSGSPTANPYTPWTEAEVLAHLATGWGEGAITRRKDGRYVEEMQEPIKY